MGLANEVVIERPVPATAAGTTDVNGTGVDMAGFEGVLLVALFGTLTATQVTSLKAQQSEDNGVGDSWADLAGSDTGNLDDADDGEVLVIDIVKPLERYVRPVVNRGTANAVIDGVLAIKYKSRKQAQDALGALALARKTLVSPSEGTA